MSGKSERYVAARRQTNGQEATKVRDQLFIRDYQLFGRTFSGAKVVIRCSLKAEILRMFHNYIGHWNFESVQQFMVEGYLCPIIVFIIYEYVHSCYGCQKAQKFPRYRTAIGNRLTELFDTFLIDFEGPISVGPTEEQILLPQLNIWSDKQSPTLHSTKHRTRSCSFLIEEIIFYAGPPDRSYCTTENTLLQIKFRCS